MFCGQNGKEQTLDAELLTGIQKLRNRTAKKMEVITVSDKGNDLVMTSIDIYKKQVQDIKN